MYKEAWVSEQGEVRTLGVAETRRQFSRILDDVYHRGGQVIVEKHGIPIAAIVPIADTKQSPSIFDHEGLLRTMTEVDHAMRAIPRDERGAAVAEALAAEDGDVQGPGLDLEELLDRDDIRELLTRLANR